MMKKYFYSLFAAAAMLTGMTSCAEDAVVENASDNEVEVTFTTTLEGAAQSRAIGDGETAKYLYFGAYLHEGTEKTYLPNLLPTNQPEGGHIQFADKTATVKLRLVKGQTYSFFFWAQSTEDKTYYDVNFAEKKVNVVYKDADENTAGLQAVIDANDEKRDAFWTVQSFEVNGPLTETITLKRPFAQVNVGIPEGELAEAKKAGVNLTNSAFHFEEVATTLNVFDGTVSNPVEVTYTTAGIPEKTQDPEEGDLKNVDEVNYEYIAMNYILVNDATEGGKGQNKFVMNNADFTLYDGTKLVKTYNVPNLPVQRNWRTNIIGSVMADANFTIVIDPIFTDDYNYPDGLAQEIEYASLNGGKVTLTEDVTLVKNLTVAGNLVIDLNGKTLTYDAPEGTTDEEKKARAIMFRVDGSLTFEGTGAVDANGYVASANAGGVIKVNGNANYYSKGVTVFQANGGKVHVNGGRYEVKGNDTYGTKFVLNHVDSQRDNGLIEVTGGTFVNFDPANNAAEGTGTNFVKKGYASYARTEGTTALYEVKPATGKLKLGEDAVITSLIVPEGESLELDLGGKKLTVLNNGLVNYGTMVVKNGEIISEAVEASRRNIYNYGTMTIDGVTFDQKYDQKGAAINNEGKMVIETATVTSKYYAIWNSGAEAELTINGGTYTATTYTGANWAYCVSNQNGAKLTVNGGTFSCDHGVVSCVSGATAQLNKGTFECRGVAGVSSHVLYAEGNGSSIVYDVDECTLTGASKTYTGTGASIVAVNVSADVTEIAADLKNGENVTLNADVTVDATLTLKGGILDGAGNTISNSTKTYVVNVDNGGVVKNLTIDSGSRGFVGTDIAENLVMDNVHISGVGYPINIQANTGYTAAYTLTVTNSTLIGWTSYTGLLSTNFTDCTFGIGTYYQSTTYPTWDGTLKPYVTTTLKDCSFENGFCIDLSALKDGEKVTFDQCKVGATVITKENFATLLKYDGILTATNVEFK